MKYLIVLVGYFFLISHLVKKYNEPGEEAEVFSGQRRNKKGLLVDIIVCVACAVGLFILMLAR